MEFVRGWRDDAVRKGGKLKKAMINGFMWMSANGRVTTEKKIRSEKIITDARMYDIACEMNYYMARLQLKEKFIFDFIIEMAKSHGFTNENTKKLLNFHYFTKQNSLNKLGTNHSKRKKALEDKYRHL